jgi:DNA segregation ATPase FtsK/SpoIIIE-like protein
MYSLVIVIDEFADLLDSYDYSWRDAIEKMLKRFGQMARAAWVYMVLLTQRATSTNIPWEIRTHFSGRIWLRMNSEADSFYVLEQAGAEKLPWAGHFLLKTTNNDPTAWYVPLVSKEKLNWYKQVITALYTV